MVRKMPRHIVLPNGMWRFVKGGARSSTATKTKRRGGSVARYKKRGGRRGGSSFGTSKLMKIAMFAGAAAFIAPRVLPNVDARLVSAAAGFMAGGPIGLAGYFAPQLLSGVMGGASSSDFNY